MNKRNLHHRLVVIRRINVIGLVIAFLFFSVTSASLLRLNNKEMIRLKNNVFAADKDGEGVEEALNDLRSHVYSHMNTDLSSGPLAIKPPIQLKYTYERLVTAEKTRVEQANAGLRDEATKICEARFPAGQLRPRAQCVDEYLSKNITKENSIPKELYQFDFISPRFSFDLAGITLIIASMLGLLLILRFGIVFILERLT